MENAEEKTDCEVCKQLIKEKHKFSFIWKIACILLAATTLIFAYLYFGSGAMTTETTITVENSKIENQGDDGTIIIGNENEIVGKVESKDNTPIVCITIIIASVVLIVGGAIIANHFKKEN